MGVMFFAIGAVEGQWLCGCNNDIHCGLSRPVCIFMEDCIIDPLSPYTQGRCGCKNNNDCPGHIPYCLNPGDPVGSMCVECVEDNHCPSGEECQSNVCVPPTPPTCSTHQDCPDPKSSRCFNGNCVNCGSNTHCDHITDKPYCHGGNCVECTQSDHCEDTENICTYYTCVSNNCQLNNRGTNTHCNTITCPNECVGQERKYASNVNLYCDGQGNCDTGSCQWQYEDCGHPDLCTPEGCLTATCDGQDDDLILSKHRACGADYIEVLYKPTPIDVEWGTFEVNYTAYSSNLENLGSGRLFASEQDFEELGNMAYGGFYIPRFEEDAIIILTAYIIDEDEVVRSSESNCIEYTFMGEGEREMCYDSYGRRVDCDSICDETVPNKRYRNVFAVPIPLHFSFASKGDYTTDVSESLNCGDGLLRRIPPPPATAPIRPQFRLACYDDEFADYSSRAGYPEIDCEHISGDNAPQYIKRNVTRYTYEWKFDFDIIATVMAQDEVIPVLVGEDQYIPPGGESTSCSGEGVLCYTEVPTCGDFVCDWEIGENCVNCEHDCGSPADNYYAGNCGSLGCVDCVPQLDPEYIDERQCLINRRQKGEFTNCAEVCLHGAAEQYFGEGETVKDNLELKYIRNIEGNTEGKEYICCGDGDEGDIWNVDTQKCEIRRGFHFDGVNIQLFSNAIESDTRSCCESSHSNLLWARINVFFKSFHVPSDAEVEVGISFDDGTFTTKTEDVYKFSISGGDIISFERSCLLPNPTPSQCTSQYAEKVEDLEDIANPTFLYIQIYSNDLYMGNPGFGYYHDVAGIICEISTGACYELVDGTPEYIKLDESSTLSFVGDYNPRGLCWGKTNPPRGGSDGCRLSATWSVMDMCRDCDPIQVEDGEKRCAFWQWSPLKWGCNRK